MKKIAIMVMLLLMIFTLSCESPPTTDYIAQMVQLEEPFKADVDASLTHSEYFWFTHEYVLNDEETLFYAPKTLRMGSNLYLNDEEAYYIRRIASSLFSEYEWELCDQAKLKEIFKE